MWGREGRAGDWFRCCGGPDVAFGDANFEFPWAGLTYSSGIGGYERPVVIEDGGIVDDC